MQISEERMREFKEIFRKEYGKEMTDEEAYESARNLVGLVEILYNSAIEETKRQRRLKKEPGGFPTDGNRNCLVCHTSITSANDWYDRYGQKCLDCKRAQDNGDIPTFVSGHRESYYSMWHLKDKFGIKSPTARKDMREGKLIARIIKSASGAPHEYIFLKKENPQLVAHDRYNPVRKSYDRHREKMSQQWSREQSKKMKEEIRRTRTSHKRPK